MSHWQTYAALAIVAFAIFLAMRNLVLPFVRAFSGSAAKNSGGGCGGGCSSSTCATKKKD